MVGSILMILFSLVSVAGVATLINGKPETMTRLRIISLSFFTVCHLFLLALGIIKFYAELPITWLIAASIFIIASRILNGLALYGKNNWSHYIVTLTILLSITMLHIGNY